MKKVTVKKIKDKKHLNENENGYDPKFIVTSE